MSWASIVGTAALVGALAAVVVWAGECEHGAARKPAAQEAETAAPSRVF